MEKRLIKCTCKGVQNAAKKEQEDKKKAGAMNFIANRASKDILHGGWRECKCRASLIRRSGPWRPFEEEPGNEYRDPKDRSNSILMLVVADTNPIRTYLVARWCYSMHCFVAENNNEVIGPETLENHAKIWVPIPEVSDELWKSTFPPIQTSKEG